MAPRRSTGRTRGWSRGSARRGFTTGAPDTGLRVGDLNDRILADLET